METEINSQQNKLTKQLTVSFQNEDPQPEECQHQPQHQQQSHRANCKYNQETEKYQHAATANVARTTTITTSK